MYVRIRNDGSDLLYGETDSILQRFRVCEDAVSTSADCIPTDHVRRDKIWHNTMRFLPAVLSFQT